MIERRRRTERALALVALAAVLPGLPGCAADPDLVARAGIDPVGSYEFVLVDDGEPVSGGMEITGEPGAYEGRIYAEGRPDGSISTVTTGGDQVTVTADFPGMVLVARLAFEGDSFTGDWALRGEGGTVEGRRVGG